MFVNQQGCIMVYSWLKNIQFALLPGRCVLCRANSDRQLDLCAPCQAMLTRSWPQCHHCGLPTPGDTEFCGACVNQSFYFRHCIALAVYQHPLDKLIQNFKYQRQMAVGKVLAELLSQRLLQHYQRQQPPDIVVPVPLHWRRQWRRGFNQAHFLADSLAHHLHIPLQSDCLARQQPTSPQQGMHRNERLRNLRHAFNVVAAPRGRRIALVDDVVTTGATANLLSRMLIEHGAEQVDVWCLARTPQQK